MATKKKALEVSDQHSLPGGMRTNREPLFIDEKLAICYRNRPHDDIIGVPYATWQELCLHYWSNPSPASYALPEGGRGMGLKAPDAVPLDIWALINGMTRSDPQTIVIGARPQVVWIYPVIR